MAWEDPERYEDEDRERLIVKKAPGPGMRNAGIGLTLGGLAAGAIGAGVAAAGAEDGNYFVTPVGVVLAALGGAMFLTGVPLWAVGAARYKGNRSSASAAGVSFALGAASAAVQGRF